MSFLNTELEFNAFTNLLTNAAVNKRLLMRVLALLEKKDLQELHTEVAHLTQEFRSTISEELIVLIQEHGGVLVAPWLDQLPEEPKGTGTPLGASPSA